MNTFYWPMENFRKVWRKFLRLMSMGYANSINIEWGTYYLCTSCEDNFTHLSRTHTVYTESLYKDHLKDKPNMVLIHSWPLYEGSITWKEYPWLPVKCGLYKKVVFIYRCYLEQVWLRLYLYLLMLHSCCVVAPPPMVVIPSRHGWHVVLTPAVLYDPMGQGLHSPLLVHCSPLGHRSGVWRGGGT